MHRHVKARHVMTRINLSVNSTKLGTQSGYVSSYSLVGISPISWAEVTGSNPDQVAQGIELVCPIILTIGRD